MLRRTMLFLAAILLAHAAQPLQKITINYPTRTGQVWPLYLAKEGGYYQKYGLDANLVFGIHPAGIAMIVSGEAVMTAYTLESRCRQLRKTDRLSRWGVHLKKAYSR